MIARYDQRRFWSLCSLLALLFAVVALRLAWVQVARHSYWSDRAAHRSTRVVSQPAPRGRILDRNGAVLAVTETHTDVGYSPVAPGASKVPVGRLAAILGQDERGLRARIEGAGRYCVLAKNRVLAPSERDELRRMPAITLEDRARRRYPHGDLARRLLGTVSTAGAGTNGLEWSLDHLLAGERGEELQRIDRSDRVRSRVPLHPPVQGYDVRTSLDAVVQGIVEGELERARVEAGAHRAQAIVMDPRSGEVLALAQVPLSPEPLDELGQVDPHRVMAATDLFEPGSSFKLLTVASMLSRAVTDTATTYDGMSREPKAWRSYKVFDDGQRIHDTHPVGVVSLRRAFTVSSNIIFATAIEDLMKSELYDDLRRFGIGVTPGSGLPHEENGLLRPFDDWATSDHRAIAYGQGVSVTLLQMSSAYAALITDGYLRSPRLVLDWSDITGQAAGAPPATPRRDRVIPPRIVPILQDLCRSVVQEPGGTGHRARIDGLDVGGKTGTAQVPARTGGYLPGVYTPNFFGFVPATSPRLLVGIVMHHIEDRHASGGTVAAPVFEQVVRKIASATRYLDSTAIARVRSESFELLPDLVGRDGAAVSELASQSGWILSEEPQDADARVVAQIPQPGTRVRAGAEVFVAWAATRMGGRP